MIKEVLPVLSIPQNTNDNVTENQYISNKITNRVNYIHDREKAYIQYAQGRIEELETKNKELQEEKEALDIIIEELQSENAELEENALRLEE